MNFPKDFCLPSLFAFLIFSSTRANTSFNNDYHVTWGRDHVLLLNQETQETEIQLSLDQISGCVSHFIIFFHFFFQCINPWFKTESKFFYREVKE
jgi:hypothetical protein